MITKSGPSDRKAIDALVNEIRATAPPGARITFLNGNFNILHPGHLRLFNFAAECGDVLVVGVNADGTGNTFVDQTLRLENVKSIGAVDYAFILRHPVQNLISRLQPDFVVKGREHAIQDNPEQAAIESYGGRLLFSSGDLRFSSIDLIHKELSSAVGPEITMPEDFPKRHNFTLDDLEGRVAGFGSLNAVVIGDLIVDRYITCDALGMSQEDPTIVVTPITEDLFLGGAGIVAAHLAQLGAKTSFVSVRGDDEIGQFALGKLEQYGVDHHVFQDTSRFTTHKQRYRADGKTLLRVNEFRQHEIGSEIADSMLDRLDEILDDADLLIFSDFSYGCLPQPLVDAVTDKCRARDISLFADSQVSSQRGNISRFKGMNLITPTELEARTACRDFSNGLAVLTQTLLREAQTQNVILSLGSEGLLVQTASNAGDPMHTDRLPAFNRIPINVAGAGDSLLACSSLCMTLKSSIWEAAFLGALAAACQISRLGNIPVTASELRKGLRK